MNDPLTSQIIGLAYKVYNRLGAGFLEKVYENALALELGKTRLTVEQQARLKVFYENQEVGIYTPDFLINESLIVEVKAVRTLAPEHEAQVVNYLAAMGIDVGLLINFGEKSVEVKRKHRVYRRSY